MKKRNLKLLSLSALSALAFVPCITLSACKGNDTDDQEVKVTVNYLEGDKPVELKVLSSVLHDDGSLDFSIDVAGKNINTIKSFKIDGHEWANENNAFSHSSDFKSIRTNPSIITNITKNSKVEVTLATVTVIEKEATFDRAGFFEMYDYITEWQGLTLVPGQSYKIHTTVEDVGSAYEGHANVYFFDILGNVGGIQPVKIANDDCSNVTINVKESGQEAKTLVKDTDFEVDGEGRFHFLDGSEQKKPKGYGKGTELTVEFTYQEDKTQYGCCGHFATEEFPDAKAELSITDKSGSEIKDKQIKRGETYTITAIDEKSKQPIKDNVFFYDLSLATAGHVLITGSDSATLWVRSTATPGTYVTLCCMAYTYWTSIESLVIVK